MDHALIPNTSDVPVTFSLAVQDCAEFLPDCSVSLDRLRAYAGSEDYGVSTIPVFYRFVVDFSVLEGRISGA